MRQTAQEIIPIFYPRPAESKSRRRWALQKGLNRKDRQELCYRPRYYRPRGCIDDVCRVIEGPTTEKGLHDFLVLLSLCETRKYKNVDFLDFLLSGLKDVNDFTISQSKRRLRSAGSRT